MTKEEVQAIRKMLGVSQERFAALIGATTTTVNRWENGKAKPSRLYQKEMLALKGQHAV